MMKSVNSNVPIKTSPTTRLTRAWQRLSRLPGGRWIFNRLLATTVPYSATIGAQVLELTPGYARVKLKDRKKIRNHLNSIHAVALVNLGELTSGLALNMGLSPQVRGIVTNISTDYYKKARGTLTATCRCQIPRVITTDIEHIVQAEIHDTQGDKVVLTTVTWQLSPKPEIQSL